jgi:glycine/D-amino acid oxidase-like deaminating enzyme
VSRALPTSRRPASHNATATAAAAALLDGARASFDHLEDLVARDGPEADYRRCGRFVLACNRRQLASLQREVEALGERAGAVSIIPRECQREQIGSDLYHGGVLIEEAGALHPAKLHRALRLAARAAGAELHGHAEVRRLERGNAGMTLTTTRGLVQADQIVVATNGYTGALRNTTPPLCIVKVKRSELV